MPRVIFLKDFDYKPVAQQTFSYKEGDVVLVKQDIADIVIEKKFAELTDLRPPSSGVSDTIKKYPNKKKAETTSDEVEPSKEEVSSEVND